MALKNCSYFSVPQFLPCSSNSGLLFPRHPLIILSWSSRILDTLSANTTCSQAHRLKLVLRALGFSPEETQVVQDKKCADSLTLMHYFCHGRKNFNNKPNVQQSFSVRMQEAEGTRTIATETNSSSKITSHEPNKVGEVHSVHVHEFIWRPKFRVTSLPRDGNTCVTYSENPMCVIAPPPLLFAAMSNRRHLMCHNRLVVVHPSVPFH